EFLSLCPDAIAGRYIAITAVDSGSFHPRTAIAPPGGPTWAVSRITRLESVAMLQTECCYRKCCGFDESYFRNQTDSSWLNLLCQCFLSAIAPPNVFQFVNCSGFQPPDPQVKAITDLFFGRRSHRFAPNPFW